MSARLRQLLRLCGLYLFCSAAAFSQELPTKTYSIKDFVLEGLSKTDPAWLQGYLPLKCPCVLTSDDLQRLQSKLMTTQVFQNVEMRLEPLEGDESYRLHLTVEEKWTVIPVVRAAFGGGTPLLVAGIYDSHFLGSLWTVGAESRTYGSAPTGGVVWARAPRWQEGSHYINFEVWSDKRIRNLYDAHDRETGSIFSNATTLVMEGLSPFKRSSRSSWQWGLRLNLSQQNELRLQTEAGAADEIEEGRMAEAVPPFWLEKQNVQKWQLKLVYDNLAVLHLNLKGWRFVIGTGPSFSNGKSRNNLEQELFFYSLWSGDWNFSWHQWLGLSDDRSYQSQYFLGGFESIRGLPDGVLFGNKAFYTNIELRKILGRTHYAWIQAATYLDYGSAATTMAELKDRDRATWGVGVRIAVPQVNRLMLRVDYAWSLNQPHTGSISAGMNQFIDPYRPL